MTINDTDSKGNVRLARRRLAQAVLLVTLGVTGWFFFQVWNNVSTLATRTLPGIGYAANLLDRGADLEIQRLTEQSGAQSRTEAVGRFNELMASYGATVVNDEDRANLVSVKKAFAVYADAPSDKTWLRLRTELLTLHEYRHQRALMFANESKTRFTSVLIVNVIGLAGFFVVAVALSAYLALSRMEEARPDDF
jgi:hypothetical protein